MTMEMTPEQIDELTAIKKAFLSVLEENDGGVWADLDNEQRKTLLPKVNAAVNGVIPEEERFFTVAYTIKDEKVEMMAISKEMADNYGE